MSFATLIKEIRISNHLTQKEFAESANINLSNIKTWERGTCLPCNSHITKLLNAELCAPYKEKLNSLYISEKIK